MSRFWKGLLVVGVGVAVLAVLALAAVYLLVGTERGSAWALDRFLPDAVAVERVDGRILGPLTLHGVDFRGDDGTRVEVDRAHLEWRPPALLRGRAHVTALEASGVRFTAGEEEEEEIEEVEDLPEVRFPVAVELDRVRVSDVSIRDEEGEETLALEEIHLRGGARESTVEVAELRAVSEEVRGGLRGSVELAGDYPLDVSLEWEATLPDQPLLSGAGTARGSLADLRVEHRLDEPAPAHLEARVTETVGDLAWNAELEVPRFHLARLDEGLEGQEVELTAAASGTLQELHGRASLVASVEGIEGIDELEDLEGRGVVEADVEGGYGHGRVALDDLQVRMPELGGRLSARGEVLVEEPLTVDVTGEWSDLAWPPVADPLVLAPEGRFAVDGTLDDYAFDAEARVAGRDIPDGWWWLEGEGSGTGASARLAGTLLDGSLEADGAVTWEPDLAWNVGVTGEDLDLRELHPEADGRVAFEAVSDGRLVEEEIHADVIVHRVSGRLRDDDVEGTADVSIRGEALEVRQLHLDAADSRLEAAGSLDDEWDMTVSLDAPDLAVLQDLYEEFGGWLQVEAALSGPRDDPRIDALAEGGNLDAFGVEVEELELRVDVHRLGLEPSAVELHARRISAPQGALGSLDVDVRGTRDDHRLAVGAQGLEGALLEVALEGGLDPDNQRWAGTLEELSLLDWAPEDLGLEGPEPEEADLPRGIGRWTLEAPVGLHVEPEAVGLETACLRDGPRELCLGGDWAAGIGGEARLAAAELPLEAASPWLPDLEIDGSLEADAEVVLDGEGAVERLTGDLRTSPGALRYEVAEEEVFPVAREFREIHVHGRWIDDTLDARLALDFVEEGDDLRGTLRVTGPEPWEAGGLEGELVGSLEDRGLAGVLVPELDDTQGTLSTELRVGGTVDAPEVTGRLALDDAGAEVLPAGIRLQDAGLELTNDDGSVWNLAGLVRSGEGEVTLEGLVDLDPEAPPVAQGAEDGVAGDGDGEFLWAAELAVQGEDFEAFNTADARVVASPDLEARGGPERIDLLGEVAVPEARITPEEREAVVEPSPDVQVVGLPEDPLEQPTPMDVYTEVTVVLGDQVHVDAAGLTGRLAGSLTVVDGPDIEPLGRGQLEVVEGEFTMYGQTLVVDRGRLIFADGPVTNPGLDIRVSRTVEEVLVGLDVRGTAERPEGEVFSEPAMAEADALAYLVLGRPLRMATEEEGDIVAGAARTAGMAGAEQLAARLGEGLLGLQEAYIDPGNDVEEARLVVGAQVTPSIHVGYALGLFEAGDILRIRYNLGERWLIRTETGEESGGDLFYTIER